MIEQIDHLTPTHGRTGEQRHGRRPEVNNGAAGSTGSSVRECGTSQPPGVRFVLCHCSACGGAVWSNDAIDHGMHSECYATLHGHAVNLLA